MLELKFCHDGARREEDCRRGGHTFCCALGGVNVDGVGAATEGWDGIGGGIIAILGNVGCKTH